MKRNLNYAESQAKKKAKSEGRDWKPSARKGDPPESEPVIELKYTGGMGKEDKAKYERDGKLYEEYYEAMDDYGQRGFYHAAAEIAEIWDKELTGRGELEFAMGYWWLENKLWEDEAFKKAGGDEGDVSNLAVAFYEKYYDYDRPLPGCMINNAKSRTKGTVGDVGYPQYRKSDSHSDSDSDY